MKIAIISSLHSPNSRDLQRAATARGFQSTIYALNNMPIDIEQLEHDKFYAYDAYIFRGYNKSYQLAQSLAGSLLRRGKLVLDSKLATGFVPSKFHEALVYRDYDIPHITTRLITSVEKLDDIDSLSFPLIIKDVDSQKGRGVRLCHDEAALRQEISKNGKNIIIQDFVKMDFDIRVLIVGDEIIGAIKRETIAGDFRSNVSLGAEATQHELTNEERSVAIKAHKALGYDISGVDLAYDETGWLFVIETNITPEWQGFGRATGIDVAAKIIEFINEKRST